MCQRTHYAGQRVRREAQTIFLFQALIRLLISTPIVGPVLA